MLRARVVLNSSASPYRNTLVVRVRGVRSCPASRVGGDYSKLLKT